MSHVFFVCLFLSGTLPGSVLFLQFILGRDRTDPGWDLGGGWLGLIFLVLSNMMAHLPAFWEPLFSSHHDGYKINWHEFPLIGTTRAPAGACLPYP